MKVNRAVYDSNDTLSKLDLVHAVVAEKHVAGSGTVIGSSYMGSNIDVIFMRSKTVFKCGSFCARLQSDLHVETACTCTCHIL